MKITILVKTRKKDIHNQANHLYLYTDIECEVSSKNRWGNLSSAPLSSSTISLNHSINKIQQVVFVWNSEEETLFGTISINMSASLLEVDDNIMGELSTFRRLFQTVITKHTPNGPLSSPHLPLFFVYKSI